MRCVVCSTVAFGVSRGSRWIGPSPGALATERGQRKRQPAKSIDEPCEQREGGNVCSCSGKKRVHIFVLVVAVTVIALLVGLAGHQGRAVTPGGAATALAAGTNSLEGVWYVMAEGAPFQPHLFTFHSDGTMLTHNPETADPQAVTAAARDRGSGRARAKTSTKAVLSRSTPTGSITSSRNIFNASTRTT